MNLKALYALAERDRVEILDADCPECLSMSLMTDDGDCYVGIDERAVHSENEKLVRIAHELGPCETGSFYTTRGEFDLIEKHEYHADKWAVKRLIPYDELIRICQKRINEIRAIAEYFGVTEDFVRRARAIYQNMGYSFS